MTPASNRRAPGTGSLFQLKTKDHRNGYWVGLRWVTDTSGNKKRVPVGDWDRDAAEAKLDALVAGERLPANLGELRALKAEIWAEGAVWAAINYGLIESADVPWLGPDANPYREENKAKGKER